MEKGELGASGRVEPEFPPPLARSWPNRLPTVWFPSGYCDFPHKPL